MGALNYRMFRRLGVYQDLCRTWTCQVITVNAAESQEPEQLPAVVGERCFSPRGGPSPTSCCQLQHPCTASPTAGWASAAHLSSFAEFGGVGLSLAEFPLQSAWCWSEPLAGSGTSWDIGNMGPSAHNTSSFPKQAKNFISTQAEDLNTSHFCRKICFFEMRNKTGFHSFPQGHWCRCWCRHTFKLQPWLSNAEVGLPGKWSGSRTESLATGKAHNGLSIPGIRDPFPWHCPEVCYWEAILHSEIPYLQGECNIYYFFPCLLHTLISSSGTKELPESIPFSS